MGVVDEINYSGGDGQIQHPYMALSILGEQDKTGIVCIRQMLSEMKVHVLEYFERED